MNHTPATLQAACAEIARSIGPDARVTITVGHAFDRPVLYLMLTGAGCSELRNTDSFDGALCKARAIAAQWTAKATAAEREYASWSQPALLAAE